MVQVDGVPDCLIGLTAFEYFRREKPLVYAALCDLAPFGHPIQKCQTIWQQDSMLHMPVFQSSRKHGRLRAKPLQDLNGVVSDLLDAVTPCGSLKNKA